MLFARVPQAGQVKTRLIPALGAQGASLLHERLLQATLSMLQQQQLCHVELWLDRKAEFALADSMHAAIHVQQGTDLGERLRHAACAGLRRHRQLIFIGSDCPALDADYLEQALQALAGSTQVVLGPALDGGYVLLGLKGEFLSLFTDIQWGGEHVLQQTLDRIRQAGLEHCLLKPLPDIDRPEDLQFYFPVHT